VSVRRNVAPETLSVRLGSADAVRSARARRRKPRRTSAGTKTKTAAVPRTPPKTGGKGAGKTTGKSRTQTGSRPVRADAPAIRARQLVVAVGVALVGLGLLGRSAQLQLLEGDTYRDAAQRQATTAVSIQGRRGPILDRDGGLLATSVDVDSVFAEPRRIEDPARTADRLAPVLGQSRQRLLRKLSTQAAFTYLARRVDPEVGAAVRRLELVGVGTHQESKRFYPHRSLAAHVLGFVNIDGEGRSGVEHSFDSRLHGSAASVSSLRDALGQRVLVEGLVAPATLSGHPLTLTLDRRIQHAADRALAGAARRFGAPAGAAVVLEVDSGDILALSSWPAYNPNNLEGTEAGHWLNRAVGAMYEPGSTMKILTLAAALEEGVIRADDEFHCEDGSWSVGNRVIRDASHRYGTLTISDILAKSSNICSAKIGMELGAERLHGWLTRFGIGRVSGVELPGEVRGRMRAPGRWQRIDLANVAFGQGIAATPLQIAQAVNVVAANGWLHRPRIVRGAERPAPQRVLRAATARELRRMMEAVVSEGTGRRAAIDGIRVAGKTGTAQKFDTVSHTYSHSKLVTSFVGFAPAEDPEVTVLVLLDEPTEGLRGGGGEVAAPAVASIIQEALRARGMVLPEPAPEPSPLVEDRSPPAPAPLAEAPPLEAALSEAAQAVLGLPGGGAVSGDPFVMPDLGGLGVHEVLRRCQKAGCVPVFQGTGRVRSQEPAPGASVVAGARWRIGLSARNDG
jgi:cell division protein FtsI (penicillin-binding protein 3)